jgi:HIRAN domain
MKYSIVGMQFRGTEGLVKSCQEGYVVTLKREPTNQYDINAIQVWIDDTHVGYIPKKENGKLAKDMDKDGKEVTGQFCRQSDGWPAVDID